MMPESGTKDVTGFSKRPSNFLTFSNGAVGNGRKQTVTVGKLGAKKPYQITLFGNGRDCPEPPSLGSTPGHPKICPYFTGFFAALYRFSNHRKKPD
jgi:hypothetical protein